METHEFDKIDLLTFATGGCAETEAKRIAAHILTCDLCRSYVETFSSENAAFIGAHPFEATVPAAAAPARRTVPFRMRTIYGIAASIAIAFTTGYLFHAREPALSSRIKGSVGLTLYVKTTQGEIEKRREQVYTAGERIQFLYSCDTHNKFMLLSIDTTGTVTRYYPASGDSSDALEPGQDIPLSHSIQLDEYAGKEVFIGVFSENKQYTAHVQAALTAGFARTNNLDSISLALSDAVIWKLPVVVIKGKR
jgi:hypothetical protein